MPVRRANGTAAIPNRGFEHRTGPANLAAIERIVKSHGKNPASQREIDEVLTLLARREAARQAGARLTKPRKRKRHRY